MDSRTRFLVALGSSHACGLRYLERAHELCAMHPRMNVVAASQVYKNNSQGCHYNSLFYNCVLAIKSPMHPRAFFRELMNIEHALGRVRTYRNARRTIDIDVLISLDLVYKSSSLFIPHHNFFARNFFVIPSIDALRLAGWPMPIAIARARLQFASNLDPVVSKA